jgi:ubiquinol-cytochrome c reductase iron-sulfur subunit
MSRRSAELVVSASFLATALAGGGFVAAYVLEASPQVLGTLLGVAFAALALGLVLWSMKLLPGGTYVEKREPMQPPEPEQDEFVDTLQRGEGQTPNAVRRALVLAGLGLAAAAIVPLRSLLLPGKERPDVALAHTLWRPGMRMMTREGKLIRADEVAVGTSLTVFPEGLPDSDDSSATLVRLDPAELRRRGAKSARGAAAGIVVFSKLCTHAGCPVGLYEQTAHQLFCPCHQSVFDVIDAGRAIAGPAVRALPQLPVSIDGQGYVVADGDFLGQVGPTYWRRGS